MSLTFTQGEQVIKNWNYGTEIKSKKSFFGLFKKTEATSLNLTVTNKRIISEKNTRYTTKREEISTDAIKGVSTSYTNKPRNKIAGIIAAVCGGLFFLFMIIAMSSDALGMQIVPFFFLLPAIVCLIIFLTSRKKFFKLNIYSDVFVCSAIDIYAGQTTMSMPLKFFKNATPAVSVEVEIDVANEIIDTIGALTIAK